MRSRINFRLTFIVLMALAWGGYKLYGHRGPSFLGPGVRLMAYVTNTGDGTVSAVDLVELAVTATTAVGAGPSGIRAHPRRAEIWGASSEGHVWVLDARSGQLLSRITVGGTPLAVDFSPDGNQAYVAAPGTRSVFAINCETRRVAAQTRVGRRPWLARASADGKMVLVTNRDEASVTVLNAATLEVTRTIAVAEQPEQILILPDASKAFATTATGLISVVDLKRGVLLTNIPIQSAATDLALTGDTGQLVAPAPASHGIAILYTSSNEYGDHVPLGTEPRRVALTQLQSSPTLYVADRAAGRVFAVDFAYRLPGQFPISVGRGPGAMRLTPDERLLLVVNEESNDLAVIRRGGSSNVNLNPADPQQRTDSLITLIPVGARPRDIAVKEF